MIRRLFIKSLGLGGVGALGSFTPLPPNDRAYWLSYLDKIGRPVLENLARNTLKTNMPVEGKTPDRPQYTYLEAFARLMAGLGPWLNLTEFGDAAERQLHGHYTQLARQSLDNATNPAAADYMNFDRGAQPLVDAAFLAYALLRARRLWEGLDATVKDNVVKAFRRTRVIRPGFNNWLLFSGMIEAFFVRHGYDYDRMRLDYALRQHEQWYLGDGLYSDGSSFHWDYYNSYVIHPFLLEILTIITPKEKVYEKMLDDVTKRAVRYAAIQERLIAPDGTFPVVGRSIAYRAAAFHHLANMAFLEKLPEGVQPAQVRPALTAVMQRTTEPAGTFDANGWLQIGLHGHQPALGEGYISTGSLYGCSLVLMPLGLPATHPFWSAPAADWTAKKVWGGKDIPIDHALY